MTKYEAERLEDVIEIVRDLYDNANIYLNAISLSITKEVSWYVNKY